MGNSIVNRKSANRVTGSFGSPNNGDVLTYDAAQNMYVPSVGSIKTDLINESVTVLANTMYTVWGNFTIDPDSTLENYGRIAIVNGTFDNQGIFDNHGTLELIDVVDQGDNGLNVAGRIARLGGTLNQPRTSILGTGDSERLAFGHDPDDLVFEWFRRNNDALKSFAVVTDGTDFNTVPGTFGFGEGVFLGAKGEFIDYLSPYEYSYLDITKSNILLRNEGQDASFNNHQEELLFTKGQVRLFFDNSITGVGTGGYTLNLEFNDFTQGAFFIDNTSDPIGLQYGGNYHINYTDRTLVDKEYVDLAISGVGGGVAGSGITNKIAYWSNPSTITSNVDFSFNGNNLALGGSINPAFKSFFFTDQELYSSFIQNGTSNETGQDVIALGVNAYGSNNKSNYGVQSVASGTNPYNVGGHFLGTTGGLGVIAPPSDYEVGVFGQAGSNSKNTVGVIGDATSISSSINVGGRFNAGFGSSNYSLWLQDGTESFGKVLTCVTADGKAQWQTPNTFPQTTEVAPPLGGGYTVLDGDYTIFVDTILGNMSISLPSAALSTGRVLVVKKKDATNTVNVVGDSGELIDANNIYAMTTQYDKVTIQCDGNQWWIIG